MAPKTRLTVVIDGDPKGAKSAAKETEKAYEGLGKSVEGVGSKMRDALTVGLAGAGIGAGAAFMESLSSEVTTDKLAAQLGAQSGSQWAADLGAIAGDLYGQNFGDSLADVTASMKTVLQNGLLSEDATNDQIESMTATAMTFVDVLDQDLSMAAQAAGNMLRNGLAKDGTEAFDILTRGVQQGADKAGDLAETFQEYATQFRELGLSGAEATGLLVQGVKAGARDADTVADSLKEFAIRARDGSDATSEGFKALGLDGKAMGLAVATGGEWASGALDLTLDKLRSMQDPVARDAAAVALFGTKAEDLGDALWALDPSSAVDTLGKVEGASTSLGDAYDNDASRIEAFRRQVTTALTGMAADAIPKLQAFGQWFLDLPAPVQGATAALGGVVVAGGLVGKVAGTVGSGFSTVSSLAKGAASGVGSVYGGLGRLVGGYRNANVAQSAFSGGLGTMGGKIRSGVDAIGSAVKGFASWGKQAAVATGKTIAHTAATVASKGAAIAVAGAQKLWAGAQWALNAAMNANPIGLVVAAIALLVGAAVWAYQNVDWFRAGVDAAWQGIQQVIDFAWNNVIKPVFDGIWWYVESILIPYYTMWWNVAVAVFQGVAAVVSWAWENVIRPAWDAIWGFVENNLIPAFQTYWAVAQQVWSAVGSVISWAWNSVISPAFTFIKDGLTTVKDAFFTIKDGIATAFTTVYDLIVGPFRSAFSMVKSLWNNTVGGFGFDIPDWVPGVGGKSFKIPEMHTGGVFHAPTPGGVGFALLRDGEEVSVPGHGVGTEGAGGGQVVYVDNSVTLKVEGSVLTRDEDLVDLVAGAGKRVQRGRNRPVFDGLA